MRKKIADPIPVAIRQSIPKSKLIDGGYYAGKCRNACIARWNAAVGRFFHWRFKMGMPSIEEIQHPEDAAGNQFDYFIPYQEIIQVKIPIPYEDGRMTAAERDDYFVWDRNTRLSLPSL